MKTTKVVYIHFNDSSRKEQDYFFGSISAPYDIFTEEELGIKYDSLLVALKPYGTYRNPKISVIVGELIRKKSQRSNEKENETE